MTIRIFKREYSDHNPDLISGDDLLELAKKEIKNDIDFDGEINTIDEAFEYYNAFESIQECDLIGELEIKDKQISKLESENERYREALQFIKNTPTECGGDCYNCNSICKAYKTNIGNYLLEIFSNKAKQALEGGE
jgi:hypothetical protein